MLPLWPVIVIIFHFFVWLLIARTDELFYYCDYVTFIHLMPLYHPLPFRRCRSTNSTAAVQPFFRRARLCAASISYPPGATVFNAGTHFHFYRAAAAFCYNPRCQH
jgi:hypothetical protein